ncbi:hypothetical protein HY256_08400, partial [Candidatus Sumerlaeota bacterium]|nr:hypothetical protein [Candidatus Sumerlaeota bacterium]
MTKKSRREAEGAVCVKSGRSRLVLRAPLPGGGYGYAKRYLVNNLRRRVGNFFAGSKAEREFTLALEMRRAGLPAPEPLAHARYAGSGTLGWVKLPATYLLTREWPNQGSFREWLRGRILAKDDMGARAAVSMIARFIACAHRHGFYHDDCSADHILVAPDVDPQAALLAKG